MLIRAFKPADAGALAALFHASVRHIGIRDYSAEQVAAWSPSMPAPIEYLRRAEGRLLLVAENGDGEPIGYVDLEPDAHIDHFYCRPDIFGTGVGSALYAELENAAKTRGITVIFVEASEAARRLFERKGFKIEARNDFEVNGVAIHNYRMSKPIG
jgi:putative acetyltransferase